MGHHLAHQFSMAYDRRRQLGTIEMRSQRVAVVFLMIGVCVLVGGFVAHLLAQPPYPATQDGVNALLWARMDAIAERQANIEGMFKIGLTAIMMNLGAHLFQIWSTRKERDKE